MSMYIKINYKIGKIKLFEPQRPLTPLKSLNEEIQGFEYV